MKQWPIFSLHNNLTSLVVLVDNKKNVGMVLIMSVFLWMDGIISWLRFAGSHYIDPNYLSMVILSFHCAVSVEFVSNGKILHQWVIWICVNCISPCYKMLLRMYLLQNLSSKHLYITAAYGIHKPCGVKSFITFILWWWGKLRLIFRLRLLWPTSIYTVCPLCRPLTKALLHLSKL